MTTPLTLPYRIPVLDKGWIELLDLMPHPSTGFSADLAVVNAARTSFLGESKGEVADRQLLHYLMRNRHTSPFEMVEFKFRIYAPLVTYWQWVRHRTWSFNSSSGRYIEFDEGEAYLPTEWRTQHPINKQASAHPVPVEVSADFTQRLQEHTQRGYDLYEAALKVGIAREMARFFLPGFTVYYTWVAKVDAHNLMNFLTLRMAQDAQYEIRAYAHAIYTDIFNKVMPITAEAFDLYRNVTS